MKKIRFVAEDEGEMTQHVGAPRGYKVLADESSARVIVGSTR